MRFTNAAIVAAMTGAAAAAHEEGTFAILQFNGKELTKARIDPNVNPGELAQHEHGFMGGSAINPDSTGKEMAKSKCTNSKVKEDKSGYWFPYLYFHDEDKDKYEPVEINYVNVYYFFDATDDDIEPFPEGLMIVGGNASSRISPGTGDINLDPDQGEIQPVQWTCPRESYDSPAYPEDSDGSKAGQAGSGDGAGTGFPLVNCDGYASPLRADVHMPSCYDPEEGLEASSTNMVYPNVKYGSDGSQKYNCPEGMTHVPHMFYEVYWNTMDFQDRWTPDGKKQPFVLSNGDVTGYSSHGDFLAAWDEDVLKNLIDNCNAAHAGLHTCSGVTVNEDECELESEGGWFGEKISGIIDKLPGDQVLAGWGLGEAIGGIIDDLLPGDDESNDNQGGDSDSEDDDEEPEQSEEPAEDEGDDEEGGLFDDIAMGAQEDDEAVTPEFEAASEEEPEAEAEEPAPEAEEPAPENEGPKIKTIWETVVHTATATEIVDEPTPEAKARRHMHNHAARHRRNHF